MPLLSPRAIRHYAFTRLTVTLNFVPVKLMFRMVCFLLKVVSDTKVVVHSNDSTLHYDTKRVAKCIAKCIVEVRKVGLDKLADLINV